MCDNVSSSLHISMVNILLYLLLSIVPYITIDEMVITAVTLLLLDSDIGKNGQQ